MKYFAGLIFSGIIMGVTIYETGVSAGIFISGVSLLVVLGGTIAAGITSFSTTEMKSLFSLIKICFRTPRKDAEADIINQLLDISKVGLKPHTAPKLLKQCKNFFIKDAIQMYMDGIPPNKILDILHSRIEEQIDREKGKANLIRNISKYPTSFGMLGTVIGLVALLKGLGANADAAFIGTNMAIALTTTLYGLVIAYFFLIPISDNLELRTYNNIMSRKIILEGFELIVKEEPTLIIKESLLSYLAPAIRGTVGRKAA